MTHGSLVTVVTNNMIELEFYITIGTGIYLQIDISKQFLRLFEFSSKKEIPRNLVKLQKLCHLPQTVYQIYTFLV